MILRRSQLEAAGLGTSAASGFIGLVARDLENINPFGRVLLDITDVQADIDFHE